MSSGFFELAQIQSPEECQTKDFQLVSKTIVWRWIDRIFLVSCFSIILTVAAADTWFAVINDEILVEEQNPVCEWLLHLAPEGCGCFIAGKICGAILVISILNALLRTNYRHGRLVIAAITLFQLGLLAYVCLSDPLLDDRINFHALFSEDELSIFKLKTIGSDLSIQIEAVINSKNLSPGR